MLYLLFVLTFLCGILFYGMSPHDKQLDMTAHQAEGMIVTFLAQHQAARDYLYTWLGAGPKNNDNSNLQNDPTNDAPFLKSDFEQMTPKSIISDMCLNNTDAPGDDGKESCFVSKVVCTDSSGNNSAGCNDTDAKHYVITYGGWANTSFDRPDWWPHPGQKMRRFESWRKAIATRTRGSISCGVLFYNGTETPDANDWCIDNGETQYKKETGKNCMNPVPSAVISRLPNSYKDNNYKGAHDLLFCMSEFKQGLPGHYVPTPTYFYDGLSNIGVGQHESSNSSKINWSSLGTQDDSILAKFNDSHPYVTLNEVLDTGISLPNTNYTVTVLAKVSSDTGTFSLFSSQGPEESIFEWGQEWKCPESEPGFSFVHETEGSVNATCFTAYNPGLISWTFVVGNCPEDSGYDSADICMSVYENAVRRSIRLKDTSISGTLTIGTADSGSGANIYGIRYYDSALTPTEIQKNFKVDQKRFGISDVSNGMTRTELEKGCRKYYSSAGVLKEGVSPEVVPYIYRNLCSSILSE